MKKGKSKVKQVADLFPHINGKQIKINPKGLGWIATVTGWTGTYLILKDVRDAQGERVRTQMIHATSIDKIELAPE